MRFFVLGANGRTGSEIVGLSLKRGHQVTACVRSPEKITITSGGLTVIKGSPEDVEAMSRAMKGHDAVFSAFGPRPGEVFASRKKRSWTMEGFAVKTISAMEKAGVKRLVLFSSGGLFPGGSFAASLLGGLAHNHMEDLKRMEHAVIQSRLEWTVARPAWLGKSPDERYRAQTNALPPPALKMSFRAPARFMIDAVEGGLYKKEVVGLGA